MATEAHDREVASCTIWAITCHRRRIARSRQPAAPNAVTGHQRSPHQPSCRKACRSRLHNSDCFSSRSSPSTLGLLVRVDSGLRAHERLVPAKRTRELLRGPRIAQGEKRRATAAGTPLENPLQAHRNAIAPAANQGRRGPTLSCGHFFSTRRPTFFSSVFEQRAMRSYPSLPTTVQRTTSPGASASRDCTNVTESICGAWK